MEINEGTKTVLLGVGLALAALLLMPLLFLGLMWYMKHLAQMLGV